MGKFKRYNLIWNNVLLKKSLLFLITEDWYFLSHRLSLALDAKEKGFNVIVACRNTGKVEQIKSYGIKCHPLKWERGFSSVLDIIKDVKEVNGVIKNIRPDILHLVSIRAIVVGLLASIFMKRLSRVIAVTGLGTIFLSREYKVLIIKFFISILLFIYSRNSKTRIILQNRDDANYFKNNLLCSSKRIVIIRGSGVDIRLNKVQEMPPSPPLILAFVGRLIKDKGIEVLIEAFQVAIDKNYKIKLIIAGSPDYSNPSSISLEYLQRVIKKNKNIEWLGEVEDIKEVWRKSHIAVLPSRREGLPKSLLEAAAAGRPIIATDVPGCREIAIDGMNAVTVKVDNVKELSEAIIYLYKDQITREQFGIKSREMVESDMSEDSVNKKTIEIYKELLV